MSKRRKLKVKHEKTQDKMNSKMTTITPTTSMKQ